MGAPELSKAAQQSDPREAVRQAKLHLRALNAQYSLIGNLYQLAGEYASLADRMIAVAEEALRAPEPEEPRRET